MEYNAAGWLEKNKDPLHDNLTRVLSSALETYVAQIFANYRDVGESFGVAKLKKRVKKGAFRNVARRHKEQLANLMTQLGGTQPHFVRCIVPNPEKRPGRIDVPLVLDQLRCNGALEGIHIARLGYPNPIIFALQTTLRDTDAWYTPLRLHGWSEGLHSDDRFVGSRTIQLCGWKFEDCFQSRCPFRA